MRSRRVLFCIAMVFLGALVHLAAAQMERWLPSLSATLRLACLLPLTKILADLLERPFRPRRQTVYYEDYFSEWVHFGALSVVAVVGHGIATTLAQGPVNVPWLALGVYGIARLTTPRR